MSGRFTSTITAKLFYLITSLVLVVVVGMTIQTSTKFKRNLTQSIQDGALSQADRSSSEIASQLDSLTGKISVILPKISVNDKSENSALNEIQGLLRNDSELITASLFHSSSAGIRQILSVQSPQLSTDNRFESKNASDIKMKALEESFTIVSSLEKSKNGRSVSVRSIAAATGLPIMVLVIRFDFEGKDDQKVYAALSIWQTRLVVTLPRSRTMNSFIIDSQGSIFASSDLNDVIKRKSIKSLPLAKLALSRAAPSGFQNVYTGEDGIEKLGVYSQIVGHPDLFILIEKDADAAFSVITRSYYSAILWAVLFILVAVMASYLGAGTATRSIRELLSVTKQISTGNFSARVQLKSADEIAELGQSVNHMASKITELMSTQVEKARYEKELETARMVQSTFFPKRDIQEGPLSVTGFYQPATECGGDLWGHYKVSESRQILFIADAMGHGAPAALVTAIGYATCQAVATILLDEPNLNSSPAKLLDRLNKIIFEAVDGKISMTFFAALIDFETGTVTYSNAGHNFPLILTNDSNDPRLAKQSKGKQVNAYGITLQLQGTPLGVDKEAIFKEKTIEIKAGDRLFLFTDGLIENRLGNSTPMGRKMLLEILGNIGNRNCVEIKENMVENAAKIFGTSNLEDDVTIVVAEISKTWSKGSNTGGNLNVMSNGSQASEIPSLPIFGEAMLSFNQSDITVGLPPPPQVGAKPENTSDIENSNREFKIKLPGAV